MSATYASSKRYVAMGVQTAKGSPLAAPTIALPVVKSQTKLNWDMNLQDEKYATGDLYILVDGIPVKPQAVGTVVVPFKPTVLNTYFSHLGYGTGPLGIPDWTTWFIGDGYNEKIYSDVIFTSGEMDCDNGSGPATWTHQFIGLHPPVPHAIRDVSSLVPAYERSFRMKDLLAATILADTAAVNFEMIKWYITAGITPYFGSKGDGTDGPSDIVMNELGASVDFTRAAFNDLVRLAYVNGCGAPGNFLFKFQTTCVSPTASHSFQLPNGLIYTDETDAPDELDINEPVTVKGLRVAGGDPSPAQIVVIDS